MKTKIFKYITTSLFAGLFFSGCLKLDQPPTDSFIDAVFWNSTEHAQIVLNMAYNQMYNQAHMWEDECLSDNMIATYGNDAVRYIREGTAASSSSHFEARWRWLYQGVKTCNVFMARIDLVPDMDPAVKTRMIAEIRFIRAMLFFHGTNLWGDMPLLLKDITVAEATNKTRTPKSEIMTSLHNEIDEIIDDLPLKSDLTVDENGRITRGAAAMLKIRFYLMQNNMPQVESWCRRFMDGEFGDYSLFRGSSNGYSSYESLFHSANEYNSEVILDYAAVAELKTWSYVGFAPQTIPGSVLTSRTPSQSLVDDYITLAGLPVKGAVTFPAPYTSDPDYDESRPYINRDPRLTATVVYDGFVWKDKNSAGEPVEATIYIRPGAIPETAKSLSGSPSRDQYGPDAATSTGYYMRKYFDPDHKANSQDMSTNKIIMRYADVLLMYAEACQANGKFTEAVWNETIRELRDRAGFVLDEALNYPAGSEANMMEIIRRERRCELALEGLRYLDIVRWGQGPTLLNRTMYGARMGQSNTQYVVAARWQYRTGRDELWSLPAEEMELIPTMRPNNPGY
jgi:hypothetical protein